MGNQQVICGREIGEKRPGETRPMRNPLIRDGEDLLHTFRGMGTLKEIFNHNAKESPHKPFLGTRKVNKKEDGTTELGEYEWKTYSQVHSDADAMANYLLTRDLVPKRDTEEGQIRFLALYAKNREEWVVTDFSCILTGVTVVTLYDTLGKDSLEYILDQTYIKTCVLSADKLKNIVELKKEGKLPLLTHVIYFDDVKPAEKEAAETNGLTLVSYQTAVKEGREVVDKPMFDVVTHDTFYTFSYTSGTTGMPKGVMLTHRNFVSNVGGMEGFDGEFTIRDDDVYISYLPLAHVFERVLLLCAMGYKMQYGFFGGDVLKLKEDLAVLRPTIMASVPRLYNRFYDVMQQKIKEITGAKKTLVEWGIAKKMKNLRTSAQTTHSVYDPLIFNKFKQVLGGRCRIMISGSAPISTEVLEFLKIAFCCQILEGYGQTECGAPATITWQRDPTSGHVGGPYRCLDVKLVDVPEMNYTSEDRDPVTGARMPRGEVCYKGYNNFKGYFRQPEQTRETIDAEGWVHTGDIGMFLPNGALKIIDRKKNIFKLAQGEYIAPDKVEGKLQQSLYIAQIFCYGDSLQANLVAIVVPDQPMLEKWAKEQGLSYSSYEELCQNPKVKEFLMAEIKTKGKEGGLFGFEVPTQITITHVPFSMENDLLTPTFKLKRAEAKKYYLKEIKSMYNGAKLQGEE